MVKKQVVMIVYNHFVNDSRVLKEATSIVNNGYDLTLYALWKKELPRSEEMNGFTLKRVEIKPIHKKILGEKGFSGLKQKLYGSNKKQVVVSEQQSVLDNKTVSYETSRKKMSNYKFFISTINKLLSYKSFYGEVYKKVKSEYEIVDYVHSHDMSTLHIGAKLAKKYKAKLIYDSHELFIERDKPYFTPNWYKNLQKKFEGKRIRKASAVITVSESIADELVERYSIKKPLIILNTPIKIDQKNRVSIKEKLGFTNEKVVMYSGGFTRGRGLEYLVVSLKLLPKNYRLVFLGFGKEDFVDKLTKIAQQEHVEDRFYMYGPVPSNEVPSYLSSANLCISPIQNVSLNNYYSLPNKVFEYIQAEVPLAVSSFPELQKLIEKEGIGTTFDPKSPGSIAQAITGFLEDNEAYNKAKVNLAKCKEYYHWENEEKKLIELYSNLEKN